MVDEAEPEHRLQGARLAPSEHELPAEPELHAANEFEPDPRQLMATDDRRTNVTGFMERMAELEDEGRCKAVAVFNGAWLSVPITNHAAQWLTSETKRRDITLEELVSEALGAYMAASAKVGV